MEIAFDRWGATQMVQDLEDMGFTVVPFGKGYSSMSAPTKEFYKILMEGNMVYGGHPVLRWMAGNVVIDTDSAGNIRVTKAREDCWYFSVTVYDFVKSYAGCNYL